MNFWNWTSELEIGIDTIDEQHKWLVDTTNALYTALQSGADHDEIGSVLNDLMDYTMNHFIVEEEIFTRLGYSETEAHKQEHDRFTQQIMSLLQQHENGEKTGAETLAILKDWLTHHILKSDKAYVSFMREHGITK